MRVSNSLAPSKYNQTSQTHWTRMGDALDWSSWTATLRGWIFLPSSSRQVHESWCCTPPLPNSGFGSVYRDCADGKRSDITPHTQAHRHCLFCCQQHSTTYWSMWQRAKSTSRTSNQVRGNRIFCLFLSETLYCTVYCIILLTRIIALYKNWCSKFSNICLFFCLSCPEESKHCIIWLLNSTTWHPYAYVQLPVTSDGSQETSNIAETDHTLYTHGWCVDGMG